MNFEFILSILAAVLLLFVMVKSADLIEESFVFLSSRVRLSTFFTGFIILGATSNLPELAIMFSSRGTAVPLSVANLLGSSLISFTLILGLAVIRLNGMHFKGRFTNKENILCLIAIQTMVFTLLDGVLHPIESIILIVFYLLVALHIYRNFTHRNEEDEAMEIHTSEQRLFKLGIKALLGIVLLLTSSSLLVDIILRIGSDAGINQTVLGIVVLSVGTNLPELTILFRAKDYNQRKLAFGNFLGSAFVIVFLMGILGLINFHNVRISEIAEIFPALLITTISVIFFAIFSFTGKKLTKYEGMFLMMLFILLIGIELMGAME